MVSFNIGYDGRLYLIIVSDSYCEIIDMNRANPDGGRIMIEEVVVAFGHGISLKDTLDTALNNLLVPVSDRVLFYSAYEYQDMVEWV